jgi:phospholipid-binding lipoprotein MlaA
MKRMLVGLCVVLGGCASIPSEKRSPEDPWESFNRGVFEFNQTADEWVLKPAATGYADIMPLALRKNISNFFNNLDDLNVFINDLLQLKLEQAGHTTGRLLLNTTVGFLGLFDPAAEYGLPKRNQDFGQTLGVWGIDQGPYLVLPLLGSSTLRDGVGLVADSQVKKLPFDQIEHDKTRDAAYYGGYGLNILNLRAELLGAEKLLDTAALDQYVFMRNAYLQKRQSLISGDSPKKPAVSNNELFD